MLTISFHSSRMSPAHCSAMAFAMPGNVLLLALERSFGGRRIVSICQRGSLAPLAHSMIIGSTIFVGFSFGNPRNHKPVFFFSLSPNMYGSMYWSGFLNLLDIIPCGFSIAIFSQSAFHIYMKNSTASSRCFSRYGKRPLYSGLNHLFPARVRKVQGGCATIMSHLVSMLCSVPSMVLKLQFPFSKGRTFCMMCHSGCPPEQGIMSQL